MRKPRMMDLLLLFTAALFLQTAFASGGLPTATRDERMEWWCDARFGMFIHFGLYSVAAGHWEGKPVKWLSSWNLHTTKAPLEKYVLLKDRFNPTQFDAERIVRLAKAAGMKYIVITTRHHEGFSLFDTKYSDYDVMAAPLKRDLMKELADACQRHHMRLGWYYSILDWYHPDYTPRRPGDNRPTDKADCASKGGNFLLNIGPKPDGTIPEPLVERLEEMGQWLAANGQSIYGTKAGP